MLVSSGLKTLPRPRDYVEVLVTFAVFSAIAALAAPPRMFGGQLRGMEAVTVVAVAFVVPALLEELVFRGLLVRAFDRYSAIVSTSLFIAWHPLEAYLLFPAALELFTNPCFLFLVGVLGLLCFMLYARSGSLWSSVLLHWLVVASWKLLGGPRLVA